MANIAQATREDVGSRQRTPVNRWRRLIDRLLEHLPLVDAASIAGAIAIWSLLSAFVFSPLLLPSPLDVLHEATDMARSGELAVNVGATMQRLAAGYALGVVGGTLLGLIAGSARGVRSGVLPLINLIRPLSPVALIPLFIIWFGIGELSKVLLVSYTTFVTLFFSAMSGVASTPVIRIRAGRSLGAGRITLMWHVILPSAVPYILTGMRIAVASAYMSVVAAELIAAKAGLGFIIMSAQLTLLTSRMFVGLACLGVLGLLSDILLRRLTSQFARRFLAEGIEQIA